MISRMFAGSILMAAALLLLPALPSPAAAREAPPLSAYGDLPSVEEMVLSPSGERIAVLATQNGARTIMILNSDRQVIRQFAVGDIKVRSFDFIDEDTLLLRRSATEKLGPDFIQDKYEFWQAILIPLGEGQAEVVFGNQRGMLKAYFGYYGTRMVEGRLTGFFGGVELAKSKVRTGGYLWQHGRPALFAVDFASNKIRMVDRAAGEGTFRDWLVGADGTVAARLDRSDSTGEWTIRGAAQEVIASGENPAGDVSLITIGKDGKTVIYGARDEASSETHWYEAAIDGSSQPRVIFDDVSIERLFTDRLTGQLIGYLQESDTVEPVFFDPAKTSKARKIRRAFGQLASRMVDWTADFGQVIVRTHGNADSGTYYKVDLAALKADALGFERPAIGPERVGPVSTVNYTASDGLEMDGILTLPPGSEAKNLPLVMLPHGGPHSHDVAGFDWWAQAFASRGYAVFQPNFRGSTNRDEAFIQAGYGQWGRKMQSDISDGLAVLAQQGVIDPSRACIVGASYGGYAALAGVTIQNGLYRCAVSVAGVTDLSLMSRIERRENSSKVRARSLEEELGPRSEYKTYLPRHQAERADAPILLIHGVDDTVVYFNQSEKMADALKDAGKPYEFVRLDGEDHWLSLPDTRKAMLEAAVAFVEKHNPPD